MGGRVDRPTDRSNPPAGHSMGTRRRRIIRIEPPIDKPPNRGPQQAAGPARVICQDELCAGQPTGHGCVFIITGVEMHCCGSGGAGWVRCGFGFEGGWSRTDDAPLSDFYTPPLIHRPTTTPNNNIKGGRTRTLRSRSSPLEAPGRTPTPATAWYVRVRPHPDAGPLTRTSDFRHLLYDDRTPPTNQATQSNKTTRCGR